MGSIPAEHEAKLKSAPDLLDRTLRLLDRGKGRKHRDSTQHQYVPGWRALLVRLLGSLALLSRSIPGEPGSPDRYESEHLTLLHVGSDPTLWGRRKAPVHSSSFYSRDGALTWLAHHDYDSAHERQSSPLPGERRGWTLPGDRYPEGPEAESKRGG
jgi:hypothetical protein